MVTLRSWRLLIAVFLIGSVPGRAMSVLPPTFPELVAKSDTVALATTIKVESRYVTTPSGKSVIKTFVILRVDKPLKNAADSEITLEFLGGRVGDAWMNVAGMPSFEVGSTDYVFVAKNGRAMCPLVAAGHGRYRLKQDSADQSPYIAREDGSPLRSTEDVSAPMSEAKSIATSKSAGIRGLSPEQFETQIAREVAIPTFKAPLAR